MLNLIARDQAGTDRWAVAAATYREAIDLARESGQQTELTFGLAGLAWLQARRGRELECRADAAEALARSHELGVRLYEVWATAALGELELASATRPAPPSTSSGDSSCCSTWRSPTPTCLPRPSSPTPTSGSAATTRRGRSPTGSRRRPTAKGQPWSLARALRCQGMLAGDSGFAALFDQALSQHEQTPDAFETARTRLAYGERMRRARDRVLAREQLRAAATYSRFSTPVPGPTAPARSSPRPARRSGGGTPAHVDELTPQELQIALLLTAGKTTRETAAALFLSPKTVEYHLRHVYQKLGIHYREQLAQALAGEGG